MPSTKIIEQDESPNNEIIIKNAHNTPIEMGDIDLTEIFVVKFTKQNNVWTADATFNEVSAAKANGYIVFGICENATYLGVDIIQDTETLRYFEFSQVLSSNADSNTKVIRLYSNESVIKTTISTATQASVNAKMDKTNPVGTGSFSMNRKENTTVGTNSTTVGTNNSASGTNSFAEGLGTIASSDIQHILGKYNIEDLLNKYAMIIGNGTSESDRKNEYTIDWEGNSEQTGNVKANNFYYTNNREVQKEICSIQYEEDNTVITTNSNIPVNAACSYPAYFTISQSITGFSGTETIKFQLNDKDEVTLSLKDFDSNGLYSGTKSLIKLIRGNADMYDRNDLFNYYINNSSSFPAEICFYIPETNDTLYAYYNAEYQPIASFTGYNITIGSTTTTHTTLPTTHSDDTIVCWSTEDDVEATTNKGGANQRFDLIISDETYNNVVPQNLFMLVADVLLFGNVYLAKSYLSDVLGDTTGLVNFDSIQYIDTKESFFIYYKPTSKEFQVVLFDDSLITNNIISTLTITRTGIQNNVNTIDRKYIPQSVSTNSNWYAKEGENGYIENRICYINDWVTPEDATFINETAFTLNAESGDTTKSATVEDVSLLNAVDYESLYDLNIKIGNSTISYTMESPKSMKFIQYSSSSGAVSYKNMTYFGNTALFNIVNLAGSIVVLFIAIAAETVAKRAYDRNPTTANYNAWQKKKAGRIKCQEAVSAAGELATQDTGEDFAFGFDGDSETSDGYFYLKSNEVITQETNCSITVTQSQQPVWETANTINPKWLPKNAIIAEYDLDSESETGLKFGSAASAEGYYSIAEGIGTKASGALQHVFGAYNIEDEDDTYAIIIGNGNTTEDTQTITSPTTAWDGTTTSPRDVDLKSTENIYMHYVDDYNAETDETTLVGSTIVSSIVDGEGYKTYTITSSEISYESGYYSITVEDSDNSFIVFILPETKTIGGNTFYKGIYVSALYNGETQVCYVRQFNGKYLHETPNYSNAMAVDWDGNLIMGKQLIIKSSTENSNKQFILTITDDGQIHTTEV